MDYDHFWFILYVSSPARWPGSPRLWYLNTRALCPLGCGVNHLTSLVGLALRQPIPWNAGIVTPTGLVQNSSND